MNQLDPIPGNILFDGPMATKGCPLNKMCSSFNKADARAAFLAAVEAYYDDFGLTDDQKVAGRTRDVIAMLEEGGRFY